MKRPIFIIVGVVIVFILLLVWLYMLFFNTTKPVNDNFSDLNLGDTTDNSISTTNEEGSVVDVFSPQALRQLTIKNVAGFQAVIRDASSTPEIYYAETGTGNIFSINTESGEETKISKTTIPETKKVVFLPNGRFALIQSRTGVNSSFYLGELSTSSDELVVTELESNIISFTHTNNTFMYAVQTNDSVIAKEYSPISKNINTLFTIPFRELVIDWGEAASDTHYAYPKASSQLEGYLYAISGETMNRLPIDGYGLSASGNNNHVIYSKEVGNAHQTYFYNNFSYTDEDSAIAPLAIIPEKCISKSSTSSTSICAINFNNYSKNTLDKWHEGSITFNDDLWEINNELFQATSLINILSSSGRELDIIELDYSEETGLILFKNKIDSTLWLFDPNLSNTVLE